jgi:hypothetical protein
MSKRGSKFTMRVSDGDQEMLSELARRMNISSKSDAIRFLVAHYVGVLREKERTHLQNPAGIFPTQDAH